MKTTINPISSRRRTQSGQSAIIAVIVLFLLLFLGAIFIALIANNLRGTKRAADTSASGRYAEAGINYMDQQLTVSPEGADWRPVPDCPAASTGQPCTIDTHDPDYFWLQPYHYDNQRTAWVGGYTRINFGGPTGGSGGASGNTGGRALVRLTYRPDAPTDPSTLLVSPVVDASGTQVSPTGVQPQPINKYIKLESVGRVGQIVPSDPTTFENTQAPALRVEQVAYKAIGINEYVLQATNKDNKPVTATLGAASTVIDRGQKREIPTLIEGPVRFNTDLTLYGVNRFLLDPLRNDQIEVAGKIRLNGIADTATQASLTAADPTRVYINKAPAANDVGNLLPSGSPDFTTSYPISLAAAATQTVPMVRDNYNGLEANLPYEIDPATGLRTVGNQNLRAVGKTQPPVIDALTGPNGLTRYRALTMNSAPLAPQFVTANNVNDLVNGLGAYAGQYGWGQGMYLANTTHIQAESEALVGGQSLRSQWLNRDPSNPPPYWQNDLKYEPPAVTIILTPRYMILRRFTDDYKQGARGFAFRAPFTTGNYTAGTRLPDDTIIRYTEVGTAGAPKLGLPANVLSYEGYPADAPNTIEPPYSASNHPASYSGDFVIYAEGNIRIRGVAGGYDPETDAFFQRHLTVVSGGGNIYVDGNLLRDNIDADDTRAGAVEVRGKSTISLLAKNSIVVNTTQFLAPSELQNTQPEQNNSSTYTRILDVNQSSMTMRLSYGPEDSNNTAPRYVTRNGLPTAAASVPFPNIFLRHGPVPNKDANVFLNIGVNEQPYPGTLPNGAQQILFNPIPFRFDITNPAAYDPTNTALPSYADPADTSATTLLLTAGNTSDISGTSSPPALFDHSFRLPTTYLFGTAGGQELPYTNPVSLIGTDNVVRIDYVTNHFNGTSTSNYENTRVGVAPLDVRIEALMYAQEGTFFIIPGPWFNPDPNDTFERFIAGEPNSNPANATPGGRRAGENMATSNTALPRTSHLWPFYKEPMDIRLTFYGAISENLPAELGDQSAWMEKWGWVPDYYGSTGLTGDPAFPTPPIAVETVHGRLGYLRYPGDSALGNAASATNSGGSGIYYQFDTRAISPYSKVGNTANYTPLRPNPYFPDQPLPLTPRLPVSPGLLYYGQSTELPR